MVRRRGNRNERGSTAVMTAIFLVVCIGMGAFVVDLAQLRQDRAFNRKSADLVATAAAAALAAPGGVMATACVDAWNFFLDNTPASGTVTTVPPCATGFAGDCDPATQRNVTGVVGVYRVTFTNPVRDDSTFLSNPDIVGGGTQAFNEDQDGSPCDRIGVTVQQTRRGSFGSVLNLGTVSTTSRSVSRTITRFDIGGPIALLILNKTDCNVLVAGGQSQIIINPSGSKPGYITVDSSATGAGCNQNNTWALDALGTQNSKILAQPNPTTGAAGVIRMYALSSGQGNAKAYDPSDVTFTPPRVSPRPTPASQRVGRDKVDWANNCDANVRDDLANTTDDCKFVMTSGPYINNLVTAVGNGTGVPTGYTTYPRGNHPEDKCTHNAGDSNVNLPQGNWYIICSELTVKNSFTVAGGSNVVFQGGLTISSSGVVAIGDTTQNSLVYFRGGVFNKDAQASLTMYRTFVYMNSASNISTLDFGAGSGSLVWTAPIGGNFNALAFWGESTREHSFGGQAALTVEGVFFIPNATFNFAGQSSQDNTAQSQFIVDKLTLSGQGILRLQPNADRLVSLPAWGATLIR
jgi:hypothetical protein